MKQQIPVYDLRPEIETFEREIAEYIGAKHAIGVASGTDALLLSLKALGIGPGDGVVVPSFTFFVTAGVVYNVGATPIFADIDPKTFNIDLAAVRRILTTNHEIASKQSFPFIFMAKWPIWTRSWQSPKSTTLQL